MVELDVPTMAALSLFGIVRALSRSPMRATCPPSADQARVPTPSDRTGRRSVFQRSPARRRCRSWRSTPHGICCASWLLRAGLDVVAVSDRSGHWSPTLRLSTTRTRSRGDKRNSRARSARRSTPESGSDIIPTSGFLHPGLTGDAAEAHRRRSRSMRGGSSVGQSRGLIILRSQVRVLPAPPISPAETLGGRRTTPSTPEADVA
jgi:hypothetical protein